MAESGLVDLINVRDIHLNFEAPSITAAIPVLLEPALRRVVREAAVAEIVAAVIKREQEVSTMCGPLSLPHARAKVDDFVISIGSNASGAIAGSREPRLIFAFVSPERKGDQHLKLLASLARLSQNRELIDEIARASSADQMISALRGAAAVTRA